MAKNYKAPGIAVHQIIQSGSLTGVLDQNVALVGPNASLEGFFSLTLSSVTIALAHRSHYSSGSGWA